MTESPRLPDELPDVPRKAPDEAPGLLERPGRVRRWLITLALAGVLLLLADLVVPHDFHTRVENGGGIKGFYGWYGFAGLVVLVLMAKLLRLFVMRPEDYYDE